MWHKQLVRDVRQVICEILNKREEQLRHRLKGFIHFFIDETLQQKKTNICFHFTKKQVAL